MSSSRAVTPLIILLVLFLQAKAADSAEPCDPDICTLPECFCSGTKIPGNLSPFSTPQIVMISFDAALVDNAFPLYEELFNGKLKNPNGCNISATFFVSHEYTSTRTIACCKRCTTNATKSLTTPSPVVFHKPGGQLQLRKNRSRR